MPSQEVGADVESKVLGSTTPVALAPNMVAPPPAWSHQATMQEAAFLGAAHHHWAADGGTLASQFKFIFLGI